MIGRGIKANSYFFRVSEVNAIYDQYARIGLTNREIWLRYIYPRFGISERTYYNYLKRGGRKEMGY
jgi:hypothetical protein